MSPCPSSRAVGEGECPSRSLFSATSFAASCLSLLISLAPKCSPIGLSTFLRARKRKGVKEKSHVPDEEHPGRVTGSLAVSSVLMSEQFSTWRRPH